MMSPSSPSYVSTLFCYYRSSSGFSVKPVKPTPAQEDTVYKKVDFMKTQAFNITRNILEKERQEPVTFLKKS